MSEQLANVVVIDLPKETSRAARTLAEVMRKDPVYARRRHRGCRPRRGSKGPVLPSIGTSITVPLRSDTTRKLRRLEGFVDVAPSRLYVIALAQPEEPTGSKLMRRERFDAHFRVHSQEPLELLRTVANVRLMERDEVVREDGSFRSVQEIKVRPLQSLGMMFVDVPVQYMARFEALMASSGMRFSALPPAPIVSQKPFVPELKDDVDETRASLKHWRHGDGTGVRIGILDTGIDWSHPEFRGRQVSFAEFNRNGELVSDQPDPNSAEHGTRVAILAAGSTQGVAPKAELAVAAAVRGRHLTTSPRIIAAIDWLIYKCNIDILNLSISTVQGAYTGIYKLAIQRAASESVVLVAATGNYGQGCVGCPGAYDEVISVGATGPDGTFSERSGHGYVPAERNAFRPQFITDGSLADTVQTSFACSRLTGILAASSLHRSNDPRSELRNIGNMVEVGGHPHRGPTCRINQ